MCLGKALAKLGELAYSSPAWSPRDRWGNGGEKKGVFPISAVLKVFSSNAVTNAGNIRRTRHGSLTSHYWSENRDTERRVIEGGMAFLSFGGSCLICRETVRSPRSSPDLSSYAWLLTLSFSNVADRIPDRDSASQL